MAGKNGFMLLGKLVECFKASNGRTVEEGIGLVQQFGTQIGKTSKTGIKAFKLELFGTTYTASVGKYGARNLKQINVLAASDAKAIESVEVGFWGGTKAVGARSETMIVPGRDVSRTYAEYNPDSPIPRRIIKTHFDFATGQRTTSNISV